MLSKWVDSITVTCPVLSRIHRVTRTNVVAICRVGIAPRAGTVVNRAQEDGGAGCEKVCTKQQGNDNQENSDAGR